VNISGVNMVSQVIVVGDSGDRVMLGILDVLEGYNVEPVKCEDIYSATAILAKSGRRGRSLVIGRIGKLSREKGRFLEKISENENFCCCISARDQVPAAKSAHVFYISEPSQIREPIENWMSANRSVALAEKKQRGSFDRSEFAASNAEIEALLGGMEK
jgi:hypothetical protein